MSCCLSQFILAITLNSELFIMMDIFFQLFISRQQVSSFSHSNYEMQWYSKDSNSKDILSHHVQHTITERNYRDNHVLIRKSFTDPSSYTRKWAPVLMKKHRKNVVNQVSKNLWKRKQIKKKSCWKIYFNTQFFLSVAIDAITGQLEVNLYFLLRQDWLLT